MDEFVFDALGLSLAFLEPTFTAATVAGAAIAMAVYSTFENDELKLKKKDRSVMVLIILIVVVATPAMLLSYTPAGSGMIYGIQGRYLFPAVPLIILCLTKVRFEKIGTDKTRMAGRISMKVCIDAYIIINMIMVYLMMKLYLGR